MGRPFIRPGVARRGPAGAARGALVGLVCIAMAWPAFALDTAQPGPLEAAAKQASQDCLHLMHHDTDEFAACVDERFAGSAGQPATQLGVAYLGLVGCLSAGRIATLHADVCARDNLTRVDRLRTKLRLGDKDLCPAVRGDCAGRVAQIEALRRELRKGARARS